MVTSFPFLLYFDSNATMHHTSFSILQSVVLLFYFETFSRESFVNEEGSLQSSTHQVTTNKKTAALFEFKNQAREAKTKFVVIIASRNTYPSLSVNLSFHLLSLSVVNHELICQQQNMLPSKRGASSSSVVREEL